MGRLRALLACSILAAVVPLPAAAQPLDDKRAEAEALEAEIASQGERLSMADEAFNEARLQTQQLESQAATATERLDAAEQRWGELRAQLSERARLLYMHPGAALDAWLGAASFGDLARAQKFGSDLLVADTELVMETERARQELLSRADQLSQLRAEAEAQQDELAARRVSVNAELQDQRALLGSVNGEIAAIMEEQRQAEIAAAQAAAAAQEAPAAQETEPPQILADEDPILPAATPEPADPPVTNAPPPKSGAATAVQTAAAQIGKPYEWAASGPDSFDCSGLTMYAWSSGGVSLPHSSRAQFAALPKVARSDLRPGDLVFFGSPIHHVGIYEGGGVMINAPQTGQNVRRDSIDRRTDWAGAARP